MPIYALGDDEPDIHPTAYVHPDAVVIGRVTLGSQSSVWPCAVLRADSGRIVVGSRTSIQDGAVIHCTPNHDTVIGDDCVIGHLAHLEGCTIESNSLVGSLSAVLERAVVGSGALIAAKALVTIGAIVPSGAMALGLPARIREHAVATGAFAGTVDRYVARVGAYTSGLRRLDEQA